MTRTLGLALVPSIALLATGTATATAQATIINPGTRAWVDAARTGRADMLILSDSVTWHGGNGWDAGFIRAAADTLGIAGSGLSTNSSYTGEGEGYAIYGSWNGWSDDPSAAPPGKAGYVWKNQLVTAGATPRDIFGWGVDDPTVLDPHGPLQMHVWHDSPTNGTLGHYKRLGYAPYSTTYLGPTEATAPNPQALTHSIMDFPGDPSGSGSRQFFLRDTTNTSIFYSRIIDPRKTGVTVTSWGLGGQSTYSFHQMYTAWSQQGRLEWLNALVDGGSGKLNIVIGEGFNDRNETRTSLGGNADGDSPQAFADNIGALMSVIRSDWTAAGNPLDDLSFTLLGMYDIADQNDPELRGYAAELAEIAAADPQASFVDLYALAPHFTEADAAGYLVDGLHPTRAGALAYSAAAMNAIVPEPSAVAGLLIPLVLLARRRRSASAATMSR